MTNYVCEDLIIEIFTRLPTKSLLRVRSLSKSWYSCIGSPGFIRMHTFRSPHNKFIIKHWRESLYTLHSEDELPFRPGRGYIGITPFEFSCKEYMHNHIVGSCNGIICLIDYYQEHITLWNPSIRRKLTLPFCPQTYRYGAAIGIGFDQITNDHKIVNIPNTKYRGIVKKSYVYATKTGAWCEIASPTPLFSLVKSTSESCFHNGALHWVVEAIKVDHRRIMTFNLSTHVFGMIELPEPGREARGLTTIQGCLAMITYLMEHLDSWIWVRRDDSWFVFFKSKTNNFGESIRRVLQLNNGGDLLFETCERRLQVYNNPERGAQSIEGQVDDIVLCPESLHLLDMGTDC